VCFYNPTWTIQCVFVFFERLWGFTLNHWWRTRLSRASKNIKWWRVLSILVFAIQLEQFSVHCVLVTWFEKLKVLLCIVGKKHCFHELLKISSDEKFQALAFQVISTSFPMFGTNVNLLIFVLLFNRLISCN